MTEQEWIEALADCYEAILKEVGDGLDPPDEETPPAATGGETNSAGLRRASTGDCRASMIARNASTGQDAELARKENRDE